MQHYFVNNLKRNLRFGYYTNMTNVADSISHVSPSKFTDLGVRIYVYCIELKIVVDEM
jgi:hypothetical protein